MLSLRVMRGIQGFNSQGQWIYLYVGVNKKCNQVKGEKWGVI